MWRKVEAADRRGDLFAKRSSLMVEWAKFCAKIKSAGRGYVVPTRSIARPTQQFKSGPTSRHCHAWSCTQFFPSCKCSDPAAADVERLLDYLSRLRTELDVLGQADVVDSLAQRRQHSVDGGIGIGSF